RVDILYAFERDYRSILDRRASADRAAALRRKLWQGFLYALKLSFGVILIVSILVAIGIIIALQVAAQSGEGDRGRSSSRRGGIFIPNLWIGNPFWHYRRPRYGGWREDRAAVQTHTDSQGSNLNFLEAVYSFIFGDGNPNAELPDESDRAIAKTIRAQGGVLTGEQVLPLLPNPPERDQLEYEDYMLPVLVKFDGQPQVSDRGEIVYQFPELQTVADDVTERSRPPALLEEAQWAFSQASSGQLMLAGGLGLANLVLWSTLQASALQVASLSGLSGGLVGFVFGAFFAYGFLFLAIPLVRWFALQRRNQVVGARNRQKQDWAERARSPEVARKLSFAQQFARQHVVSGDETVYSTVPDIEGAIDDPRLGESGDRRNLESGALG
ncbi:MAG: hypothetical protein AAFY15_10215, partial [Cyanobacteria bacterium J06648_11]